MALVILEAREPQDPERIASGGEGIQNLETKTGKTVATYRNFQFTGFLHERCRVSQQVRRNLLEGS